MTPVNTVPYENIAAIESRMPTVQEALSGGQPRIFVKFIRTMQNSVLAQTTRGSYITLDTNIESINGPWRVLKFYEETEDGYSAIEIDTSTANLIQSKVFKNQANLVDVGGRVFFGKVSGVGQGGTVTTFFDTDAQKVILTIGAVVALILLIRYLIR